MVKHLLLSLASYSICILPIHAELKIETGFSNSEPWQRQAIVFYINVFTVENFANLKHGESGKIPGFEIHDLPVERVRLDDSEHFNSVLKTGWSLLPLVPGNHQVQFPQIEYILSGAVKKRIALPVQSLSIKPLPSYIPPTLSVGKISLNSSISAPWLVWQNRLGYWTVTLQSDSLPEHRIPAVLRQIKSNDRVAILPIKSHRNSTAIQSGMHSSVVHQIPFKALHSGFLELPVIHYQYFDPVSGKLVNHSHTTQQPMVISLFWFTIALCVIITASTLFARHLLRYWQRCTKRKQTWLLAIQSTTQASSPLQIRNALNLIAQAEGWPNNITIRQWGTAWSSRYQTNAQFASRLDTLSEACYAPAIAPKLEDLQHQFLSLFLHRKRHNRKLNPITGFKTVLAKVQKARLISQNFS